MKVQIGSHIVDIPEEVDPAVLPHTMLRQLLFIHRWQGFLRQNLRLLDQKTERGNELGLTRGNNLIPQISIIASYLSESLTTYSTLGSDERIASR